MDTPSLLHKFLGNLLRSREETTITSKEPQDPVGFVVANHEVRHTLVVI